MSILGKKVQRPAIFDEKLNKELQAVATEHGIPSAIGKTMCCDDFYEGQGRLDGAICEYSVD